MTAETVPINDLLRQAIGCHERGDTAEAETAYRRVVAAEPGHAHANYLLGSMLGQLGRLDESLEHLNTAIGTDPSLADAYLDRANVLKIQNRIDDAVTDYRRAIELDPKNPLAYGNLARLYRELGQVTAAVECMESVTRLVPENMPNQLFLAELLENLGAIERAVEKYEWIIEKDSGCVEAFNNLGVLLKVNGQITRSLEFLRRAVDLAPAVSTSHTNLGMALMESGQIEAAEERLRTAVSLDPYDCPANSNLLLCLNYKTKIDPAKLFEIHKHYGERLESGSARPPEYSIDLSPEKRLRIAYVSPDFKSHSVSRFIAPILENHDFENFEVFCFSNVTQPDEVTERFKKIIKDWHDISGMSDDQVSTLVRECGIDILIDLAGHTAGNRLAVFAGKPAPVQMTYLGYPATTGLSRIDYRLTDPAADPVGKTETYHSEKLLRLSQSFLCFEAPSDSPNVGPPRAIESGQVTFGSFNTASKVNDDVLTVWSRILAELPASRLALKAWQFSDESLCRRFRERFATQGISGDRIELSGWLNARNTHLEKYNDIDIALDTFPYNGATTTCEALWMGVPVITLAGGFHAFRVGASVLGSIGLGELVTESTEEYIACAKSLATDVSRLAALRSGLRQRLRKSPLMNPAEFTRQLETAYRSAWRSHCESAKTRADPGGVSESATVEEVDRASSSADNALRLHIGGEQPLAGWKILNAVPGPDVDFVGNCTDLSQFSSNTVDQVYASHVLEHLGYQAELPTTLQEMYRVLKPGGMLYVSVPDLEILCRLFIDPGFANPARFQIMRIIYGGQIDEYDFHKVGLTWPFMHNYLEEAGFRDIQRVEEFGLFTDTSSLKIEGQPISLNVVAKK